MLMWKVWSYIHINMLNSILFTNNNMTIILGHNFKVLKAQRDILIHTWTMWQLQITWWRLIANPHGLCPIHFTWKLSQYFGSQPFDALVLQFVATWWSSCRLSRGWLIVFKIKQPIQQRIGPKGAETLCEWT